MAERPSAYLWCPAYPLLDARALSAAHLAADAFTRGVGLRLVSSPLLTRHLGPGAWLPSAERSADLNTGFAHTWLLAARGGYGCLDLLAEVPAQVPRIIGYSDLTILHAVQAVRGGPGGLYGFMPGVKHGARALASAIALARGAAWHSADLADSHSLIPGTSSGPLFAACLRVLTGLVGTPWMPNLRGHLLALEDIDEKPYQVDRDLTQLAHAGCLTGISGLILGRFPVTLADGYAGPSMLSIAQKWATRLAVPTVFGLPIGHDPDPLTLALGRATTLTVSATAWSLSQAAA